MKLEKCYGADSHITISVKRILITNWTGNAYRRLTQSPYDGFRWRLLEKTGCLIAADSSEYNKINPDLPDYRVPSPILPDPSTAPAELSSVPEHDSEMEKDGFDDFRVKMKWTIQRLWNMTSLVQMAGSSIL